MFQAQQVRCDAGGDGKVSFMDPRSVNSALPLPPASDGSVPSTGSSGVCDVVHLVRMKAVLKRIAAALVREETALARALL